jgi:hypothetical protein
MWPVRIRLATGKEAAMGVTTDLGLVERPKVLLAIAVGGGVAGALDLTSAFMTFGWRVPQGIASGLLGAQSFQGGAATWLLGVVLHFFIAFSAAAVYCWASWKLPFLKEHFLVCGLFYGIGVYLVMQLIVLPLSAVPFKTGTVTHRAMIQGLLAHMFLIGLPISCSLWKFGK